MNSKKITGKYLNKIWNVDAMHSLYREDGKWYHNLSKFPGALFDNNGYLLFKDKNQYINCKYIQHGKELHIPNGISSIPGYIRRIDSADLDEVINNEFNIGIDNKVFTEGYLKIKYHYTKERNKWLVKKAKEKWIKEYEGNIECKACGFSFYTTYGDIGKYFIEAHHNIPISSLTKETKMKISDLIPLCSNCHRIIHYSGISIEGLRECLKDK